MSSSHVDIEALETLKEVMEDEFQLLIDTFVQDSTDRLGALREALANGDADGLRRAAHSFKGSSSNIGAIPLSEICFVIEEGGRNNQLDGLDQKLAEAEAEFEAVKVELANL